MSKTMKKRTAEFRAEQVKSLEEKRGCLISEMDSIIAGAKAEAFFESEENLLGRIKGGAKFEYSTEKYEDEDDLGYVKISEVTKENVKLTSGVMTWNGETLATLCSTARVTNNADGSQRVKIGGLGNQNDKSYIIGFEHKSKKLRVIIVGKNTEGFSFDFMQDKATVIDCQFTAEAADKEGTLIIIDDLRKQTSAAGGTAETKTDGTAETKTDGA